VKYFDETQMTGIREALDAEVMKWPGVSSKGRMGCLCYFRGRKFFAVLVTQGIAVTRLTAEDRATLSKMKGTKPFEIGGRVSSHWSQQPLKNAQELQRLLPYIRKSYEAASER
jgi:hypothetical protein